MRYIALTQNPPRGLRWFVVTIGGHDEDRQTVRDMALMGIAAWHAERDISHDAAADAMGVEREHLTVLTEDEAIRRFKPELLRWAEGSYWINRQIARITGDDLADFLGKIGFDDSRHTKWDSDPIVQRFFGDAPAAS